MATAADLKAEFDSVAHLMATNRSWGTANCVDNDPQELDNLDISDQTIHIFNGKKHHDAAGRNLTYPDVNKKGVSYTPASEIALVPLWGSSENVDLRRIVAIEDDVKAGQHEAFNQGWDPIRVVWNVQSHDVPNNTTSRSNWKFRNFAYPSWPFDQDDVYKATGVDRINDYNVLNRIIGLGHFDTDTGLNGGLDHINYRLSRGVY